ncbi:MAG: ribonuclease Z [Nanoarchaeota archaeon]|nr:ribonuclease Z [Nanoarchaeota archaeon]
MSEQLKIHFLGTGSMVPDEKRNHPAFLLVYKAENILVDCGEGTQIQFRKAHLNPCKITKILLTHWHGDHTFGLPGLLRTLSTSGYKKKLEIYGPRGIRKHLDEMFAAFGTIQEFEIQIKEVSGKFFENSDFYLEAEKMIHVQPCNAYSFVEKGKTRIDKTKLKKFKLGHGPHLKNLKDGKDITHEGKKYKAKDLVFEEKGKKVSFVLDTVFNDKIVPFVKNSDALVMESTFDSSLNELAKNYMHLTAEQAARVAKSAKVGKLYLVHLSERYDKNRDVVLKDAKKVFKDVSVPKDLDCVEV